MVHSFDTDIAKEYGVNAAIIVQHLAFWIAKNKANEKYYHEGRYWTYSSTKAFAEIFDYMTVDQIRTALNKLKKAGVIVTGNFNSMKYDRTTWYAFGDNAKSILENYKIHLGKIPNGSGENPEPIPDIITDIRKDIRRDKRGQSPKTTTPTRTPHGEFHHVLLTDEEYKKLTDGFGAETVEEYITKVDEYIEQTGKRYKNHYLTVKTWLRRDGKSEISEEARAFVERWRDNDDDPF